jgi:hypothetical protein
MDIAISTGTADFTGSVIMAKRPDNHGEGWSNEDMSELKRLAKENTPTRVMGLKLGRTPTSIYAKAARDGISLKPTNQSPYNRRQKP